MEFSGSQADQGTRGRDIHVSRIPACICEHHPFRDHKVRVHPLYTSIRFVLFRSFSSVHIMALVKFVAILFG